MTIRSILFVASGLLAGCIVQPENTTPPPQPQGQPAPAATPTDPAAGGAAGGTQLAGPACDLASVALQQTSPGPCGSSIWRFKHKGDGTYEAIEEGCANATGIATTDGTNLVIDFKYADGAGRYSWVIDAQCNGPDGTVAWYEGSLAGQTAKTSIAPVR